MAILKVARLGHPILRRVADPVPPQAIGSPEVQRVIADLIETCADYDGAGLAAPQVHISLRIVVLSLGGGPLQVWVNPVLTPLTDDFAETWEGCLSVPGLRGRVRRPAAVEVHAFDENGDELHLHLRGFPAVVAQHECDHLDGTLYVDKVEPHSLSFLEEFRRYGRFDEDEELDEAADDGGLDASDESDFEEG
jgi:peptide deformylase